MTLSRLETRRLKRVVSSVVVILGCFLQAGAQQELTPPKAEIKATFGGASFDEVPHSVAGGSLRIYITRRLSIEPEFLYMRNSERDQDYVFQPSVAYDITDPTKRFVPYVIGGAGVLHHRGRFSGFDFTTGAPRTFDTSFTTWTASAGAGLKIYLTNRLFIAPEARVGREPTVRGTISVGYVFSGRE